jgi:hypothetical protein
MDDLFDLFKKRAKDELGSYNPSNQTPPENSSIEKTASELEAQSILSQRFTKLKHKTLYVNMEYEEIAPLFKEAQSSFISQMFKFCDQQRLTPPFKPSAVPEPSTPPSESAQTKDLYREIARKTHPDRTSGLSPSEIEARGCLYQEACEGKKNGDFQAILKVALELNIQPKHLTSWDLDEMEKSIDSLSVKIDIIKNDLMWQWYYCNPQDQEKIFKKLTEECNPIIDGTNS